MHRRPEGGGEGGGEGLVLAVPLRTGRAVGVGPVIGQAKQLPPGVDGHQQRGRCWRLSVRLECGAAEPLQRHARQALGPEEVATMGVNSGAEHGRVQQLLGAVRAPCQERAKA